MCAAAACFGQQQWEIGGTIGYGWNRSVRVNAPGAEAKAGITDRFVAGAVIGEDLYEHFAGEIRYLYQDGDPFITSGNSRAHIQGQSHTLVYDFLIHAFDPVHKLRPFFAIGAGGKLYRITGPAPANQLSQFATLMRDDEWRFVVSVGAGVKYQLSEKVLVRADFRDYISPFPRAVFAPAEGATRRGLFQQFTPMLGVSYRF